MSLDDAIFIVGPGRSGTTLLRSIVSAHSKVSITPETQFMQWVEEREDLKGEPRDFESFWEEYTSWVRFQDLDVDSSKCLEFIQQHPTPTFDVIYRSVLQAYKEQTGASRIGDKTPSHVRYLSLLFTWFPSARVLVTERDPRAIIASQLQTPYVQQNIAPISLREGLFQNKRLQQILHYAHDWNRIYLDILPQWKADSRVKVVSYEGLVQDPETTVRSICNFLELDFEPVMLSQRNEKTVQMPAGQASDDKLEHWRREHYQKSLGRISSDSLNKWKKRLSSNEVAVIEEKCSNGMSAKGYEPSVSTSKRVLGKLYSKTFLAAEQGELAARAVAVPIWRRLPIH